MCSTFKLFLSTLFLIAQQLFHNSLRLEKGNNIDWTDITKTFELKRGQVSKWAINNGYIYKNKKDVTNKGDNYFQRYMINGFKNVCITPQGIQLIEQHLDKIKNI